MVHPALLSLPPLGLPLLECLVSDLKKQNKLSEKWDSYFLLSAPQNTQLQKNGPVVLFLVI